MKPTFNRSCTLALRPCLWGMLSGTISLVEAGMGVTCLIPFPASRKGRRITEHISFMQMHTTCTLTLMLASMFYVASANLSANANTIWIPSPHDTNPKPSWATEAYNNVAKQGNYAYIANGDVGLQVFDVSNPSAPIRVGHLYTATKAWTVAVSGNYAYVGEDSGLEVVDISNPAAPVSVHRDPNVYGAYNGLVLSGDYAFVIDKPSATMRIYDVSNPVNWVLAGGYAAYSSTHPPSAVTVSGNYAYIVNGQGGGLEVADASNPTNWVAVGVFFTTGTVESVAVSGNYAYIGKGAGGLAVVDIGNPAAPTLVTNCLPSAGGVVVSGNYAYVGNGPGGVQVLDLSKPNAPVLVGSVTNIGFVMALAASSNYLYVAANLAGLHIISVANPAAPMPVGHVGIPGNALQLAKSGNYLYVANGFSGLDVFDVSTPLTPTRVGNCAPSGYAQRVVLSGNYAFVAEGNSLQVIDLSNPTKPTRVAGLEMDCADVAVSGHQAFAAGKGLHVFDIANPTAPTKTGSWTGLSYAHAVVVSNRHAYVRGNLDGVQRCAIVDVSNPANPNGVGHFGLQNACGLAVVESCLLAADGTSGLRVFDVSNPVSPWEMGGYSRPSDGFAPLSVVALGNYAYVGSKSDMNVFDLKNSTQPVRVSVVKTAGQVRDVLVSGRYAFIADGYEGLAVVELAGPRLSLVTDFAGGQSRLQFDSLPGVTYTVQHKTNFTASVWADLGTYPGTGGTIIVTNSLSPAADGFFRVRVE